ncbi:phosphotransferase family protein [Granulicoccus phenolivorans]|uniref:phosphotransferase family protein n=1 Tax=Granulicoccus phenolivorans TaxID=266854 RepID=UPI0004074BE8|nr:phosphotransferase family protein [Granulicoccus phenolivorans]
MNERATGWAKTATMPSGLILRLVREAGAALRNPEETDTLRRRTATKLDMALVRLITLETCLDDILADHQGEHQQQLRTAEELLGGPSGQPASDAVLAERIRQLAQQLRTGDGADRDRILALFRQVAATDHDGREELEKAIEATKDTHPVAQGFEGEQVDAADVTPEALNQWLQGRLGDAAPRVDRVTALVGGQSKHTYLLDTTGGPQGWAGGAVIRMDTDNFDNTVVEEFPLLEALHAAGVPVPTPLLLEADRSVFGKPFMVSERISGAAAGMIFDTEGGNEGPLALAEALGRLHSVTLADLGLPAATLPELVESARAKIEQMWRDCEPQSSVAVELGHAWISEHAAELSGDPIMVHGDASLHNVMLDENGLTGLVDWEFAHPGHPAEDLAYARPAVERLMPWADFLAHYHAHGGQQVAEEDIQFFSIFSQLRNASLCASVARDVVAGRHTSIDMLVTSIDTFSRMELVLARNLHAAIDRTYGALR